MAVYRCARVSIFDANAGIFLLLSCCASNLTVNLFAIIVGRAGQPVSVFNLDA
ncbi:hypothetical protein Osc7112_4238 [Oscillatoria nigro-viridis PCC 7112]|uniref:Uncharacterized protein n=1 Tax=Phormidium nigroviride PCC 7112 TaxID=179408 RepID=K9VKV3_9CYAN|nr:hypothetical protein Osc7112_4238 [Oscillatoria nigro-viridis PCC 7112]